MISEALLSKIAYTVTCPRDSDIQVITARKDEDNVISMASESEEYNYNTASTDLVQLLVDNAEPFEKHSGVLMVHAAMNDIARETRRGAGNFTLCHLDDEYELDQKEYPNTVGIAHPALKGICIVGYKGPLEHHNGGPVYAGDTGVIAFRHGYKDEYRYHLCQNHTANYFRVCKLDI